MALVTVAAWAPALGGAFHYDDFPNIVLDPATSNWHVLLARLANGFRPLLRLSYAADYALWGETPAGFLATNLVLHVLTVFVVWRLADGRLRDPLAALLAAFVFAIQPAHAAAVAWTTGRSTGLSMLLFCLALLAHERGVRGGGGWRWPALSIVLMALAAATKEVALIFPAVVLLWELTRGEPKGRHELIRRVAPSAVAATAMLAAMLALSPRLRELLAFSFAYAPPFDALANHLRALPVAFSLWFRPWALSIEHPAPEGSVALVAGAAVLTLMVVAGLWNLQRRPLLALALLWPIIMLLPSHSLIARCDLVVEKPLYGAWIGPSLALGAIFAMGLRASPALPMRAAVALAFVVVFGAAHWRARVWADPVALWREASETVPQSARAWSGRALTALSARDFADARLALDRVRAMNAMEPRLADMEFTLNLITPLDMEVLPR